MPYLDAISREFGKCGDWRFKSLYCRTDYRLLKRLPRGTQAKTSLCLIT